MKLFPLIAAALFSLTGCIDIDQVTQPTEGIVNQAINIRLDVSSSDGTCRVTDCVAEVAVMIPEDWEIGSCSFLAGDASVPEVCNITEASLNSLIEFLPIKAGYKRPAFNAIINTPEGSITDGIMYLSFTPKSSGDFSITYIGSAEAYSPMSYDKSWFPGESSEDHLISIAPAAAPVYTAIPVPSLSLLGLGLLSVLVVFAARTRRLFKPTN